MFFAVIDTHSANTKHYTLHTAKNGYHNKTMYNKAK